MDRSRRGSAGSKLRQGDAFAGVFEHNLHRHVDVNLFDGAADNVAAESRAFVEIHPCRYIRNVGRKAAQRLAHDFANDGEGKDFASAAELHPFEVATVALDADRPRAKNPRLTILAALHHQLAGFGAVPEGLVDRSDFRQGFFDVSGSFRHRFLPFKYLTERVQ